MVAFLFHVELSTFSEYFGGKGSKDKFIHHDSKTEDIIFLAVLGVFDLFRWCIGDGPSSMVPIFSYQISLIFAVTLSEIYQFSEDEVMIGFVAH